ncbi:MAG: helix-turn-helix domain-containing protein [Pseudonocardiaceae bacterium]
MDADDASTIGARARMIRRRRGLSLDVVAGLTGIGKQYLSMLELGQRGFNRRGLVEDLANALGCSIADLTGQPYFPPDRESARAKTVIAQIERGLNEATLDDVPDLQPRPVDVLDDWARSAMELRDTASYRSSGEGIDDALIELQVHLATSDGHERLRVAGLLTQATYHAFVLATTFGYLHLAQQAAQRCFEVARIAERPELEAFAMFARAPSVARTGGRRRAVRILDRAIDDAQRLTTIRDGDTLGAETFGLLHLMGAHFAARNSDAAAAIDHLDEAARAAMLTGERNGLQQHFGPTNVAVWRVAIGAELGQGPAVAERVEREPIDLDTLGSKDRIAALHFDLARSWAQAEGERDSEAVRHLDAADRIAPTRIRNDPMARDLVLTLDRRARRRVCRLVAT